MKTLPIEEFPQSLTDALNAVANGKTVVITSRGRPIADLIPHRPAGVSGRTAMARMRYTPGSDHDALEDMAAARREAARDYWPD